jgi:hypothetical protein
MMNTRPKRTFGIVALMILSPIALFLASCKTPSDAEVKSAIEVNVLETKWVMKEYRQWPNPKLVLVPAVTYQIKNNSQEPLRFININAIFKERDAVENLGDSFYAAIRKDPVPPGGLSPALSQKSNFGVEGKNLESFKLTIGWKTYYVKLFAQWKGSRPVLLGEWPVSRTIDFKEPEPVHMGKEKKEPEPKK